MQKPSDVLGNLFSDHELFSDPYEPDYAKGGILEKQPKTKVKKLPTQSNEKILSKLWIYFSVSLVLFLAIAGSTGIYLLYRQSVNRMENMDRELVDLRSAMNTDSIRQSKLQKIMAIGTQHNSNLSSVEAYDIASEIYEMSIRYSNLDIDLICAVITHESANTWRPEVISPAGAMGLMQIMPVTGMFLAEYEGISWTDPEDVLYNPVYNIRMGTRLLSALIEQYGLDGALAAYNAGERHASIWLANGKNDDLLWKETREYIPAVLALYDHYLTQTM